MTVEAVTYISDLNASYPAAGDSLVEGDDHIRNLKTGIKATFPNLTGPVTATQTTLSNVGLVFISSASASASATIDFTSGIDATYDEYELHIINAVPATGTAIPWLRTTADGSTWPSSAGDYDWTCTDNGAATNGSTTAARIEIGPGVSNDTAIGGFSAVARIYKPSGTTHNKRIDICGSIGGSTAKGNIHVTHASGMRSATAAITGVRFMFSTGNITSGLFRLYGVKTS